MFRILFIVGFLGVFCGTFADSGESMSEMNKPSEYTAEFFSYQGPLGFPTSTHSFARFTSPTGEVIDISWLPARGFFRRNGRVPLFRATPGQNYSLEETFQIAAEGGKVPLSHGVFSISPELFEAAGRRKAELESGSIAYKMLDRRSFPGGTNCIHAITGMLAYLRTGLKSGSSATASIVDFFLSTGHMRSRGYQYPSFSAPEKTKEITPEMAKTETPEPATVPHATSVVTTEVAPPSFTHDASTSTPVAVMPSSRPEFRPLFPRLRARLFRR